MRYPAGGGCAQPIRRAGQIRPKPAGAHQRCGRDRAQTRLEDAAFEDISAVFTVNAVGTILMCREAVRRMSTRHGGGGGAIVNISSTGTKLGNPNIGRQIEVVTGNQNKREIEGCKGAAAILLNN